MAMAYPRAEASEAAEEEAASGEVQLPLRSARPPVSYPETAEPQDHPPGACPRTAKAKANRGTGKVPEARAGRQAPTRLDGSDDCGHS